MKTPIGLQKKIGMSLALLFLTCNFLLLCWYLFVVYKTGFHSDSAAKVLLAREIVETGQYFPRDWNFVNGDLFVLFGHTFIIPLLAFQMVHQIDTVALKQLAGLCFKYQCRFWIGDFDVTTSAFNDLINLIGMLLKHGNHLTIHYPHPEL